MYECHYGHMVQEYYVARVRRIAQERAEARARIRTRAQVMQLRREVRRKLRRCFGRFPARTPLNARVTGAVERKHYRIEKIIYESRPNFPVTTNLYVPKRRGGPFPAVLGACGHSGNGKAADWYQVFCRNLARQGYVVLIYDPISQGERLQYPRREGAAQPTNCCEEHNMAGNQMSLLGDYFGLWRTWDGIRGLDYLLSRPEADQTRVGVTGNSGGGTLSTYLTAFDDRFTMAAPSCFVTRYLSNLENELPADSEQIPPGIIAAGLDIADFFVAQIPRPTLLLGQNNDYFDRRGLEATYEELRRLYGILGAERDIRLFVGPTNHGYSRHNREAMYRFFNAHAHVTASVRELGLERPEKEKALQVTPGGQVHKMRVRRVFDFTEERARALAGTRKRLRGKKLAARIARSLALPPRLRGAPHYRVTRGQTLGGTRKKFLSAFAVETEPGIQAILYALPRKGRLFHFPRDKRATVYVPHLSAVREAAKGKAPKADPLFAVDVRGVGQLTPQTCNRRDFFSAYDCDYFYASHGHMLSEPYCGRRVHDLLRVLDLFEAQGYGAVHLVGRGLGAITAAFAACLHPLVKQVTLYNALLSYHDLTQVPVQSWPWSSMVFGILKQFDLPDCYRELEGKKLTLVTPWTSQMRPWRRAGLRDHLKALGLQRLRVR